MRTLEWRHTDEDRSDWEPGPWDDEPDKLQWPDPATGLPCLIKRNRSGALCGYVGVPEGHPWHGTDYNEIDADVHGGLTYADKCEPTDDPAHGICHVPDPGEPDNVWWLGFDCHHGYDIAPGMDAYMRHVGHPSLRFGGESYKDIAYVKAECAALAAQAAAVLTPSE